MTETRATTRAVVITAGIEENEQSLIRPSCSWVQYKQYPTEFLTTLLLAKPFAFWAGLHPEEHTLPEPQPAPSQITTQRHSTQPNIAPRPRPCRLVKVDILILYARGKWCIGLRRAITLYGRLSVFSLIRVSERAFALSMSCVRFS